MISSTSFSSAEKGIIPGVIQANMAWKIINAEEGIVCVGNAGFEPTPLSKKFAKKKKKLVNEKKNHR
jgi:hypothetical protein